MKSLQECITEAEKKGVAIGHFNISDSEGFKAVAEAAKQLLVPVIIGVSEGEREFIGLKEVAALVQVARESGMEIFLNADHHYSVEKAKQAIDAGVDSVIIDAADKTLEENIAVTQEIVQYAGGRALVEGEVGFIGKSSKILEEVPEGISKTSPDEAELFVKSTGIDLLAPAVGNVHGIIKTGEPKLDIELIRAIREKVRVPLVLHGASGNSDEDLKAAIKAGVSIIHINTELRLAYKEGIEEGIKSGEVAPYKFMKEAVENMKEVVVKKLKLFNNL
ncbi:MAG: hypothetical protein A3J09_00955 [Candidatus Zambryskibacteria bacterium RIFCSPLOWO2_02_FULL_51_21]|uniref:Tagatose-bisphosphate aldolase n=1 Tax=Candidatus Zambryskibacteria bacterium RIFCSPHIGHO2_02_FULL_43_37 TaxID=1802749 RepID=A0A1G2THK5_9BACT|nr:MAG: hypothetical protein A2723_00955 [Candidatus Zambryskibacteria bacterium RIFCSPHIGHO2_01_FULL_52_18]OHA96767.1 MAG: hypothetical protein A3D49_02915 [Candidatus Zambryskibacteria bacterium RIFCSPHIGHO2_02_FULL_43_37]OHB07460.1 MAG: hypothetical protein A2944_01985 [Candidatus Zambryskibacteria bacterium RIFCSPLOWO2_01_FULL_52_12]OHB11123.1 MAG: hypothetical protein A3J09_00955 [Candidatus Zambryskibacteria bacterium RIFCSPLOWO2_02_FULL_51_21]